MFGHLFVSFLVSFSLNRCKNHSWRHIQIFLNSSYFFRGNISLIVLFTHMENIISYYCLNTMDNLLKHVCFRNVNFMSSLFSNASLKHIQITYFYPKPKLWKTFLALAFLYSKIQNVYKYLHFELFSYNVWTTDYLFYFICVRR